MRYKEGFPFRYAFTVSELTQEIKEILEMKFPEIWVEGEISNLRIPPSGHIYFTLKDDFSQIRAVLFKMQARALRFLPEDGLFIVCRGRLSLYEKRGEYQLILDLIEPKGMGALQLAFLQLKEKLEKEGLFDPIHKKPIPMFPQRIGIITSPTGAVIKDMLHIINRRFENISILLYPVQVQGEEAPFEIAEAVKYFNHMKDIDVIIVGRGGGSIEDLWAFNEEIVARAIHHSKIPILSAVGHETDYTISDFVADMRAPTPSAAAELVVRNKQEIKNTLFYLENRIKNEISKIFQKHQTHLYHLRRMLTDPKRKIEKYFLRVDELVNRFSMVTTWILRKYVENHSHLSKRLLFRNPIQRVDHLRSQVAQMERRLPQTLRYAIEFNREMIRGVIGKLDSLSPLSILQRGYSITRKVSTQQIIRDATHVIKGDKVEITLHRGTLVCDVEKTVKS